jgi:POT family proton-dependent oligopeptide transporter
MMTGVRFLSSLFGDHLSAFLGTFWEGVPHESFFLLLMLLGIGGGIAIWLPGRPPERAVAENYKTASKARD